MIKKIKVLTIDATINPAVLSYLTGHLPSQDNGRAELVVIKINTPGGLLSTTQDILTTIGQSALPVVLWVTPEGASATSAGAIIASGTHFLFMNRATRIGAATPVGISSDIEESDGKTKAINDIVALVRSLAQERGRSPEPFAQMVVKANSYTVEEALKQKIINGEARHLEDIRQKLNGQTFRLKGENYHLQFSPSLEIEDVSMDSGQRLLNIVAHPTTAYILFVIGVALLYFEFQAPGGYVLGGLGVTALLIAGIAFQVLPLNVGALALLILGVFLLILEVYITSYGILSLAGIAALTGGSLFLFRTQDSWLTIEYQIIYATLSAVIAFTALIAWYFWRTSNKRLKPHFFDLIECEGIVIGKQDDLYQIKIKGEIWRATSSHTLSIGDHITVTGQSNDQLTLTIGPKSKE